MEMNKPTADEEFKPPFTYKERNLRLTRFCIQKLAEELATPLTRFKPKGVRYSHYKENEPDDAKTANVVQLEVSRDSKGEVTLQIGVSRKGTDRMYSNYLLEAGNTQEDVKTWLENTDVCVPIILESAKQLSDKVDEYWD